MQRIIQLCDLALGQQRIAQRRAAAGRARSWCAVASASSADSVSSGADAPTILSTCIDRPAHSGVP